jgi:hypothetical protein
VEFKTRPIQKSIPKLGGETDDTLLSRGYRSQEIIPAKEIKQEKRFKCPGCGRQVRAKKVLNPQNTLNEQLKQAQQENRMREAENEAEKRLAEQIAKKEQERLEKNAKNINDGHKTSLERREV